MVLTSHISVLGGWDPSGWKKCLGSIPSASWNAPPNLNLQILSNMTSCFSLIICGKNKRTCPVSRFLSFLGVMNPDFWGCKTVKPLCWMIFGVVVSNPTWNIGASFVHNKHPKKNRWDHQVQKVDPRDLNLHLHIRIHHWPPTAPPGSTNTIARSLLSNTWLAVGLRNCRSQQKWVGLNRRRFYKIPGDKTIGNSVAFFAEATMERLLG